MSLPTRIELTGDVLARLEAEVERTGVPPRIFVRDFCKNPPKALKPHTVENWLSKRLRSADGDLFGYVITQYLSIQDEAYEVALTDERLDTLKAEIVRTERSPAQIVRLIGKQAPKGLTAELVSKWLTGKRTKAKRDQWDIVIAAYAKL